MKREGGENNATIETNHLTLQGKVRKKRGLPDRERYQDKKAREEKFAREKTQQL